MADSHEMYSFGDFTLDPVNCVLLKGETEVRVEEKGFGGRPFDALLCLVKNANKLVTKDQLIFAVLGEHAHVTDDTPRKWIEHARNALGDDAVLIQTVRRRGWRLRAKVRSTGAVTLEPADNTAKPLLNPEAPTKEGYGVRIPNARPVAGTFEGWIGDRGLPILLITVLGVAITIVIALVGQDGTRESSEVTMQTVSGVQGIVIVVLLIHSFFRIRHKTFCPVEDCEERDILEAGFPSRQAFVDLASELEADVESFLIRWRLLLMSWLPLYAVLTFGTLNDPNNPKAKIFEIVFNVANTLALVFCFNALNKHMDQQDEGHFSGKVLNYVVFMGLVSVLAGTMLKKNFDGAMLLTGIAAGVTMALFVGRLQSKFLGSRFWVIYLLYSYTAIQPLVLYLNQHPDWGAHILNTALALKCLLYLVITWLFQTGLLLFYFARVRDTDTTVYNQRRAFLKLVK